MKKLFLLFILILIPFVSKADDSGVCGENLTWGFNSGTNTLTISGTGEMNNYNWYSTLAPWYEYRKSILKLIIENGVTSIGSYTFYYCSALTSITIPNSVTSIGENAFFDCSSLTSLTIPNSVTSIGEGAFAFCSGLTSVTIPNSVTSIGSNPFSSCPNLTSLIVSGGNTKYDSRNNCNAIIETFSNTLITGCKNTVIPNSVTNIGADAFRYCIGLTSITIPNSVTRICKSTFAECHGLTSITIPNSVKDIGDGAFYYCSALTSITIPNSVTSIGEGVFRECSGLTSIMVSNGNSKYDSRNNCNAIIETSSNTLITGCKNTVIPNSVTSIGESAFFACSGLTSITIPNSVNSIGKYAFIYCSKLQEVKSEIINPFEIAIFVFNGISSEAILYVPTGTKAKYQAYEGWTKNFKEIVESSDGQESQRDIFNPVSIEPASGTLNVLPKEIYLTFDNFVKPGTGSIMFRQNDGSLSFSVNAANVAVNNNVATITHDHTVVDAGHWTVEIPEKAFHNDCAENDPDYRWNAALTLTYIVDGSQARPQDSETMKDAKALLKLTGVGYPKTTDPAWIALNNLVTAEETPADEALQTSMTNLYNVTDVQLPEVGKWYYITGFNSTGKKIYLTFSEDKTKVVLGTNAANAGAFKVKSVTDNKVVFQTKEGLFLHVPTILPQHEGTSDANLTSEESDINKLTFTKFLASSVAGADPAALYGAFTIYGSLGKFVVTDTEEFAYAMLDFDNTTISTYPNIPVAFASKMSSAFMLTETTEPTEEIDMIYPTIGFVPDVIDNAGDDMIMKISGPTTTTIADNSLIYYAQYTEEGVGPKVAFSETILTSYPTIPNTFVVNTNGLAHGMYYLIMENGAFAYTAPAGKGIRPVTLIGGPITIKGGSGEIVPTASLSKSQLKAGDYLVLTIGNVGKATLKTPTAPYYEYTDGDKAGTKVTFSGTILTSKPNTTAEFNLNTAGLAPGNYRLVMPSETFQFWAALVGQTVQNVELSVTFEITGASTTQHLLNIYASGNGSVMYNDNTIRNGSRSYTVNEGDYASFIFTPDNGYRIGSVMVNNSDVTYLVSNNQYSINSITTNTTVDVTFEAIPVTTYSLSITASGNGSVNFDGTTVKNRTQSFTLNEGSDATITFNPDNGNSVSSVKVNGRDVTSQVTGNRYTISNITANTTLEVSFQEDVNALTVDELNYTVTSQSDKTVTFTGGDFGLVLTVPATITQNGTTWKVTGIDNNALKDNTELAAIIWNPEAAFTATVSNPNLLLYVKSAQYVSSTIKNVVVNGTANSISLVDAASGNNFYCPQAFTAQNISYTHHYTMMTGIGESRGWETIALPFDVQKIEHASKGTIVPFAQWRSGDTTKPFWLYELKSNGFAEASSIKANTPYVISMPNNPQYSDQYQLVGNVTFSAENATVKVSDNLPQPKYNDRAFVPNFQVQPSSLGYYALNVTNDYFTNNSGMTDGSRFVLNMRRILPFEAYMTTSSTNAPESIGIFDDMATEIQEIPNDMLNNGNSAYDLQGRKIDKSKLTKGVYIRNGQKVIIR